MYDAQREYSHSISVLQKLIEISEKHFSQVQTAKFVELLQVRALLGHDTSSIEGIKLKYSNLPKTPIQNLLDEYGIESKKIIMETIEKQDIFGDFTPISDAPYLKFNNQDEAITLLEDYYDEGRYILNLLDVSTSLHQSISIDVGKSEEVNIVDRTHTFKIQ